MTPEERIDAVYQNPALILREHEKPAYILMRNFHILALLTGLTMIALWLIFFPELYPVVVLGTLIGVCDYIVEFRARSTGYNAIMRAVEEFRDQPPMLAEMVGFVKFVRELEENPETQRLTEAVLQNVILWPLGIRELWRRIQYLRSR
ncbi:MAG: hypothetical protein ACYTFG_21120 [Planctomycetota bacterium]|jgi:hypothetical protein